MCVCVCVCVCVEVGKGLLLPATSFFSSSSFILRFLAFPFPYSPSNFVLVCWSAYFNMNMCVYHFLMNAWSFFITLFPLLSCRVWSIPPSPIQTHTHPSPPPSTHTHSFSLLNHSHGHFPSSCSHLSPYFVLATRRSSNSKSHCSHAIASILWKAHRWWDCYCVAVCLAAPPRCVE